MTIECTPQEFENLVKLVSLGSWMVNGIRPEEERIAKFKDVEQAVYAAAHDTGLSHLVEYSEAKEKMIPTQSLETDKEIEACKEYYDSEIFWTELTQRLAMRDFLRDFGHEVASMPLKEQAEKRHSIIERYVNEFEKNGVDNLALRKNND